MTNQVVGTANQNLLKKRGWETEDRRVFTKGNLTLQKAAGNKFAKWHLHNNGQEVHTDGELSYMLGFADREAQQ